MGADIFITEEEAGMTEYKDMGAGEMRELYDELARQYERYCALGLELNMARGKPSPAQLELSMPLLDCVNSEADYLADDGTDCRNYGVLAGLPEARALIADMLDVTPEQVVICGGSSLNIMFDTIARAWITGLGGQAPWSKLDHVKFICPSPGYDRHFAICEHFGIEMLPIELGEDGPDVAEIARLVADPAVKGIWCVPQYSNPCGYTYWTKSYVGWPHSSRPPATSGSSGTTPTPYIISMMSRRIKTTSSTSSTRAPRQAIPIWSSSSARPPR